MSRLLLLHIRRDNYEVGMNKRKASTNSLILILISILLLSGCQNKCPNSIIKKMQSATVKNAPELGILEAMGNIWQAQRGCKGSYFCENDEWIIYEKGDGCEVAYSLTISGNDTKIPFFYIDLETGTVYSADDEANYGTPEMGAQNFEGINIIAP